MEIKDYKDKLDNSIGSILKKVDKQNPHRHKSRWEKFSDDCCTFFGAWSWFWWLTGISLAWITINRIPLLTFDPYPFGLYTMIISIWALYSNVFVQMSTNGIMKQLMWMITQIFEINKRIDVSIMLLHEKYDVVNQKIDYILDYIKQERK